MGNNSSKQTYSEKTAASSSDCEKELIRKLNSHLSINSDHDDAENPISVNSLANWEQDVFSNPKNKLAQNAFTNNSIESIIQVTKQINKDSYLFNNEIDTVGSPSFFDNQKSSGRCWIFATCNVLRSTIMKNYNIENFQLSQNYLFFYDKLEKANFFLEQIIENSDAALDSRLVSYLNQLPLNDGGQWDMIVNVIAKYGLIPHELFPDTFSAANSSKLNYLVNEKLREFGLILRNLIKQGKSASQVAAIKTIMVKEIYGILVLTLGTPPKSSDAITWEYFDKTGKFNRVETTPKKFYEDILKIDVSSYFSLINDPRNAYNKLYTVDKLNNIVDGKPIEYVNVDLSTMKKVAIKMIQKDQPIFFGCDVGKFSHRTAGILDVNGWDYKLGFNTGINLSKAERLSVGSSAMTHAMVLTGVHLNEAGEPVRWKIENSWGDEVGEKGYFVMTDEWFSEFVFQIVTSSKYASKQVVDIWNKKDFSVLPFYDPMGALA